MKCKLKYYKLPHLFMYDNRVLALGLLDYSVYKKLAMEDSKVICFCGNILYKNIQKCFDIRLVI